RISTMASLYKFIDFIRQLSVVMEESSLIVDINEEIITAIASVQYFKPDFIYIFFSDIDHASGAAFVLLLRLLGQYHQVVSPLTYFSHTTPLSFSQNGAKLFTKLFYNLHQVWVCFDQLSNNLVTPFTDKQGIS